MAAGPDMAKKLKNEKALLKVALAMIMDDAVKRGIVELLRLIDHVDQGNDLQAQLTQLQRKPELMIQLRRIERHTDEIDWIA